MRATAKRYVIAILFLSMGSMCQGKDYPASLFGIYSDGITLNTRSIQFAIDYIHEQGGGRLVFDVGRFLTGSLHLRSGVTLHLLEGAVLLGVTNPADYDRDGFTALILARDAVDIGITGKGVIDGQGRDVARNVVEMVHKGLIKDAFRNDRPEVEIRPMLFYFRSCTNVRVKGITMQNAAAWVQTYDQCKNVDIDGVTVSSHAFWNNDGFDLVDCDSVKLRNCYIDAADDGICLKSHDAAAVCQNILLQNCRIRSSASGIKFGTASQGGFRNVRMINNTVFNTYRSAIALEAVDGGFLENIEVDTLTVLNSGNAIFMRIGERVAGKVGRLQNIRINHVDIQIAFNKADSGYQYEGPIEDMPRNISPAIIITGLPQSPINHIEIANVHLTHPGGGDPLFAHVQLNELDSVPEKSAAYPEFSMFKELPAWGVYVRHAADLRFSNLQLQCVRKDYRTAIVLDDVHGSTFSSVKAIEPINKKISWQYRSSGNVFK